MINVLFKIKNNLKSIDGKIFYKENEFIFQSDIKSGEFSLMIGKGYCELSISKYNMRVNSFGGINFMEDWIEQDLKFPESTEGELYISGSSIKNSDGDWYTKKWKTYYDKKNGYICIGNYKYKKNCNAVEFCKDIIAMINNKKLKAIWLRNINF